MILFKSSAVIPGFLKTKHYNSVPITLKKVATTGNGVKFYNSYRRSLVVDVLNAINFKKDDKRYLTIQEGQS